MLHPSGEIEQTGKTYPSRKAFYGHDPKHVIEVREDCFKHSPLAGGYGNFAPSSKLPFITLPYSTIDSKANSENDAEHVRERLNDDGVKFLKYGAPGGMDASGLPCNFVESLHGRDEIVDGFLLNRRLLARQHTCARTKPESPLQDDEALLRFELSACFRGAIRRSCRDRIKLESQF